MSAMEPPQMEPQTLESPPSEPIASEAALTAAAEPESERGLLAQLDRMVQSGQVRLAIDRRKLSHLDFPLSSEADGNIWVYALVPLTALIWWRIGSWAGLASAVASVVLYQTAGRAYVARRLDRRIRERGIKDMEAWRALWRFGGVILTPAGGKPCQGPEGSWHAIARGAAKACDYDAMRAEVAEGHFHGNANFNTSDVFAVSSGSEIGFGHSGSHDGISTGHGHGGDGHHCGHGHGGDGHH